MHNADFERGLLRAFAQQGLTPDRAEALIAKRAEKRASWWPKTKKPNKDEGYRGNLLVNNKGEKGRVLIAPKDLKGKDLTDWYINEMMKESAEKRAVNLFIDSATAMKGLKNLGVLGALGLVIPPAVALGGGYAAGRMAASGYDAMADQVIPKPKKDVEEFKSDELARQMLNRMDRLKRKVKHQNPPN